MTLVVSTSSPWVSVALIGPHGLTAHGRAEAHRAASGAVVELVQGALDRAGARLESIRLFVADVGPGSFSGVKVGVTMVKSWGLALGSPVGGVSAFDLVDPQESVALPVRKGLWLLRTPGQEPVPVAEPPSGARGYGWEGADGFPDAARAALTMTRQLSPSELVPAYLSEPSISVPKVPHIVRETP
ncbi:MAG: hypothetical protein KF884_05510 [Fimbriimonadaceae bacterium]|nr:MAG: hypothetical protein KF884_05510 [Fimbriimonadaceae bacterium]